MCVSDLKFSRLSLAYIYALCADGLCRAHPGGGSHRSSGPKGDIPFPSPETRKKRASSDDGLLSSDDTCPVSPPGDPEAFGSARVKPSYSQIVREGAQLSPRKPTFPPKSCVVIPKIDLLLAPPEDGDATAVESVIEVDQVLHAKTKSQKLQMVAILIAGVLMAVGYQILSVST